MKHAPTLTILGMVLLSAFAPTANAGSETICLTTLEDTPIIDNPAESMLENEVGWGCATATITYLPQTETCDGQGCSVTIRSELTVTSPACGRLNYELRACSYDEPVTVSTEITKWLVYGQYSSQQEVCVAHNHNFTNGHEWCRKWTDRYTLTHPIYGSGDLIGGLLDAGKVQFAFMLNGQPVYHNDRVLDI